MKLLRRMIFLLRGERFDRELAEEMRLYVDLRAERLRERAVASPEAERVARRAFGNANAAESWSLIWQGLGPVAAGLIVGIAGAMAASQAVSK
jgi:hypothetical protein